MVDPLHGDGQDHCYMGLRLSEVGFKYKCAKIANASSKFGTKCVRLAALALNNYSLASSVTQDTTVNLNQKSIYW